MDDTLLALSIPVLVFASGIYGACDTWWRRRHPAPPSPYTHQAARLAERAMLTRAEGIVDGAYEALAPLYDPPGVHSPRATADVTPGADASRDHGRSAPAAARRR
ncbi:hypothetical protein F0344_20720 [Streptomyces finlayi]|uniref:Uncharacterized protein n=1 Tax=Streptomyces finlayi TaxID=67296 RepID=A0A7G7BN08_9ACTN|nr:hypothetical protein [Streptomyces finlayi]QNE76723.1 hypothetical protein F0344_20720 [Streptomyces finlayi]